MDETERACLLANLNELQQTIRAYDTKAQIMGIGFLFSIGMIGNFLSGLELERNLGIGYLLVGFVLLLGPVALFGAVLHPSRKSNPALAERHPDVRRCFYYMGEGGPDLEDYLADVENADWRREIVYEIGKLSALRDLKRLRFLRAMWAAGFSFAVILLANALKVGGVT